MTYGPRHRSHTVVYIGALSTTNLLTTWYGQVPAGFGLMVTAGTYAAGLTWPCKMCCTMPPVCPSSILRCATGTERSLSLFPLSPALSLDTAGFLCRGLRQQPFARAQAFRTAGQSLGPDGTHPAAIGHVGGGRQQI